MALERVMAVDGPVEIMPAAQTDALAQKPEKNPLSPETVPFHDETDLIADNRQRCIGLQAALSDFISAIESFSKQVDDQLKLYSDEETTDDFLPQFINSKQEALRCEMQDLHKRFADLSADSNRVYNALRC